MDLNILTELGEVNTETDDPTLIPRGWYKANPDRDRSVYKGLEEALQALKDVLLRDRYVVSLDLCVPVHMLTSLFL